MTIGIRGMGLIGGSFEKAFRAAGHDVRNLKGASRDEISACRLVVVCLPPLMVAPWIREHSGDFAPGTLVTDAAGVKSAVCRALAPLARRARWTYVGGHPMAGREVSGYANSLPTLFQGASMIFTPYVWTPKSALAKLRKVFADVGFARFVETTPAHHDAMIAYTSQLAHVVSSAYVCDSLAKSHCGYSAGSFQDMTRVATVDPDVWTDLFMANRRPLSAVLDGLISRLGEYRDAISSGDSLALRRMLAKGRRAKETVK